MRVVGGIYRSRVLVAPIGLDTRPTLDNVKEALFNVINYNINNSVFVDLFSGSGGIGIEAISRGAKKVYFNDINIKAYNAIKNNLNNLKIDKNLYSLTKYDYVDLLNSIEEKIDYIFLDPPYNFKDYKGIIDILETRNLLKDSSMIIIEQTKDFKFEAKEYYYIKEKIYGSVKLLFITRL